MIDFTSHSYHVKSDNMTPSQFRLRVRCSAITITVYHKVLCIRFDFHILAYVL